MTEDIAPEIRDPKTKLADYLSYDREINELWQPYVSGFISGDNYRIALGMIEGQYSDRIFPEDRYVFQTVRELRAFIERMKSIYPGNEDCLEGLFNYIIERGEEIGEISHLGFSYRVWVLSDEGKPFLVPELFIDPVEE